ncbi:DUF3822 family protein [Pedobacter sp.]|uniref:DUF3822 family protein n=1 Tax=Pedobacter sp. TaxID=1411316 RepID=UPI003D7F535D
MNTKNSLLLLDPEFDPHTAPACNLLLKITKDSFSYAIINQEHKELKAVFDEQECSNTLQTLKRLLKNDPYLSYPFATVKIAVNTDNCVTVPNKLFSSDAINSYTNFFSSRESGKVHTRPNYHFDFTAVFNIDQGIENVLDQHFESAKKVDHQAPLLSLGARIENGLLFDFTALSFSLLQVNEGKLYFKNTFEIINAEEFNYYLLLLLQQLEPTVREMPVYLMGIVNSDDEKHLILKKYFKNIQFTLPQNDKLNYTILEDMPPYYYSNLLAIDLCV